MVNHEAYMRMVEGVVRHGSMTVQERMDRVTQVVTDYVLEMEEEHNQPFDDIKVAF